MFSKKDVKKYTHQVVREKKRNCKFQQSTHEQDDQCFRIIVGDSIVKQHIFSYSLTMVQGRGFAPSSAPEKR